MCISIQFQAQVGLLEEYSSSYTYILRQYCRIRSLLGKYIFLQNRNRHSGKMDRWRSQRRIIMLVMGSMYILQRKYRRKVGLLSQYSLCRSNPQRIAIDRHPSK